MLNWIMKLMHVRQFNSKFGFLSASISISYRCCLLYFQTFQHFCLLLCWLLVYMVYYLLEDFFETAHKIEENIIGVAGRGHLNLLGISHLNYHRYLLCLRKEWIDFVAVTWIVIQINVLAGCPFVNVTLTSLPHLYWVCALFIQGHWFVGELANKTVL